MFITDSSGESHPAPRPPAFQLRNIDRLRRRLLRSPELSRFLGPPLAPDEFSVFVDMWCALLPAGVVAEAVADSLLPVVTTDITHAALQDMCWRFAGNVSRLRSGEPVPPWRTQRLDEWAPVEIVEVTPRRSSRGSTGADFVCRVLAGSPAGRLAQVFLTTTFCQWISPQLGFTRTDKDFPFTAVHQWSRLRLLGFFRAERSLTTPRFVEIAVPNALRSYNHALVQKRARKGFVCPQAFMHPCHVCHIGYDRCPVAVRPRTLVKRPCPQCDKFSYFDPGLTGVDSCLSCYYRYRLKRVKR